MSDIYHYCKLNTAIEHILCDKRLLLNPIKNTNDPRENKSFDFGATTTSDRTMDVGTLVNRNKEVSDILRRDCKVICFSEDQNSISGFQLSRMWALYGDNHKGFCIQLDKETFLNENTNLINPDFFRSVKYKDFNPNLPAERKWINHDLMHSMGIEQYVLESFRPAYHEYLYFTKNEEWQSEQEVRLIYFSEKNKNEFEYCSIAKSLRKIYLGIDFSSCYLTTVRQLSPDTNIYRLRFIKGCLEQWEEIQKN